MGIATSSLGRWTRRFTLLSAVALVGFLVADAAGAGRIAVAVLALFGFVCPMIFGMAYLLLPSFAGRTLVDQRLPAVHFALTVVSVPIIVGNRFVGVSDSVYALGVGLWSAGVAIFVGALAWTVVPAVVANPKIVVRNVEQPQRSTRLATAAIPVAVGFLVAGTWVLLATAGLVPTGLPATMPRVLHFYTTGFGTLLIFALGIRLMTGFFHVAPPRYLSWLVLFAGVLGPTLLATFFGVPPWFRYGAVLEAVAMGGYGVLVAVVAARSEWRRVGLYGIVLGAAAGVAGVLAAVPIAFGVGTAPLLEAHATFSLTGFFVLTVVGYAYQFFPVTAGTFPGANDRTALATIGALASGVLVRAVGVFGGTPDVRSLGALLAILGAVGYCYLVGRRILGD